MESVSFKAYLKRDGQEVEVRRFGIDGGAATNYLYLRGKIQAIFPSVQNDHFNVFWQDQDKDYITISSDEELMEALTAGQQMLPIKLYIHVNAQRQTQGSVPKQTHSGVVCDACEGPVSGYRYKCVTCPDYDLCATCEAAGLHQEHFMLRMPTPIPASCHPKFFRKLLRHPHKFHKKHSWNRVGEMMGEGLGAHESCPFTQRSRPTTAGGVVDMFDFTALMEFINSLGVATGGESAANEPTVGAQGFSEAQASAPGPQPSAKGPQPAASGPQQTDSQRQPGPKANEYLTGIGHAIAAFLDPFGVDVTFDVRSKQNEAQDAAASSSSQNTPLFTPTTSQSTPLFKPNTTQNTTLFTPTTVQNTTLITPTTSNKNDTLITPTIDNNIPSAAPATQPNPTQIVIPITTSQAEPAVPNSTTARRNSDDWTLLNRESPNRFDAEVTAMDVEEPRGARPKVYPELPSAPTPPSVPLDSEQERIQRATDSIRSMGFNFPPALLAELLRKENCDIAKVLEVILTTGKK